ncbi:MAG: bifunctional phosphoglucose/phosphomannose isomerase [Bacteroidota bacterium]
MTFEEIFAVDVSNMYNLIKQFPQQVREAVAIGNAASIKVKSKGIENIVLCGLGGSAIGGDLLKSYLAGELTVPFIVNRSYTLPKFVGSKTLVIVSSYSGNTEETNAAHREAIKRRAKILCISSNGTTGKLAKAKRTPLITIPGGLPPRAALGYSFFPLLIALSKMGFIKNKARDIRETITLLEEKSTDYGTPDELTNNALQLAAQLRGRLGVIYTSTERLDAVNTRWRGQVAENAKSLLFGHVLPEMNHNELVGWKVLGDLMSETQVLFLRDKDDHKRIAYRMDITKQIIGEHTERMTDVWSEGTTLLARMFSLVYLGDWVSYYLAILHQQDPMPVAVIDHLKNELGKI